MRKTIFILVWVLCGFYNLSAQQETGTHSDEKLKLGVQAGFSLSHFIIHDVNRADITDEPTLRFTGGVNADIPLKDQKIYFRPELLLNLNGHKQTDTVFTRTHLSYIKIPANLVFQLCSFSTGASNWSRILLGFGPYLAYALHGNYKQESEVSRVSFTNKEVPSTTVDYGAYFKRWDAGINSFFEFASTHFYSQFGSSFGLLNIKPGLQDNSGPQAKYKNFSLNLSYGWRF
jgi:hypothetical protein